MEVYSSVLRALLERPDEFRRGLALSRAARVAADALYFNLMRLEGCGWVESAWDIDLSAVASQRVQRRHYRLTTLGKLEAVRVIKDRGLVFVVRLPWNTVPELGLFFVNNGLVADAQWHELLEP